MGKEGMTWLGTLVLLCAITFSARAGSSPRFVENKGQYPQQVEFKLCVANADVYFERDRLTFIFFSAERMHAHHDGEEEELNLGNHAYQMQFLGSGPETSVKATGRPYPDYTNYISRSAQVGHVRSYDRIRYDDVYAGIDLEFYESSGHLKYDIVLAPGSVPDQIAFKYEGADEVLLRGNRLYVKNTFNTVEESIPIAYQVIDGERKAVECRYVLTDNTVGFEFPADYDRTKELIIDPVLVFVSYSGSTSNNFGFTATYDDAGSLYGGGIVFGPGYPYVLGSYSSQFVGMPNPPVVNSNDTLVDIGISKFSDDGTTLLYSTYISGSSAEAPHSLIVNSQGQLVILGSTSSPDFPVSPSAYDGNFNGGNAQNYVNNGMNYTNGSDLFIFVLSADGSSMVGSTFLGGSANDGVNPSTALKYNYNDLFRGEVIVDEQDNIFIASTTLSNDFPVTAGAHDVQFAGSQDAVVAKFNSDLSVMEWCTYLGGSGDDSGYSLKLSSSGDVYVTGGTTSTDLQMGSGAYIGSYQGGSADGYVCLLEADGSGLVGATYIGSSVYDQSYFVEVDDDGDVYLFGQSLGAYPVSTGVYSNTNGKQFIQKLTPDLSTSIYSTVFGSGSSTVNISPTAFLVDICEKVYISGWGGSTNGAPAGGNTANMAVTNDAMQSTTDGSDFYFMVLDADATSLLYGSYLGGPSTADHVDGGTSRFDKNGVIYQAVCASCGSANDFPTTSGAWSEVDSSVQWFSNNVISGCNLGVIKLDFQITGVQVEIIGSGNLTGCAPFEAAFDADLVNASSFVWHFGDGDTSIVQNPTHTYLDPGIYEVLLIGTDTSFCTGEAFTDTAVVTVTVSLLTEAAEAGTGAHLCPGDSVMIGADTIPGYTYLWTPSLGLSDSTAPAPIAFPTEETQYHLTILNPDGCEDRDSVLITVFNVSAFPDTTLCIGDSIQVSVVGGYTFAWLPTDGVSDPTSAQPYITAGFASTYTVTASDGNCEDTAQVSLGSLPPPIALFDVEIYQSCWGDSVRFINLTEGADSYSWNIGGEVTTEFEPLLLFEPGDGPIVTLTAFSGNGECIDSAMVDYMNGWYSADSVLFHYPNVITPNGDSFNDCFRPEFVGDLDECYTLKVFSRWGRLLYDSEKHGGNCWDGTQRTGDLVSEGTYYYISVVRGMDHAGYVTVIYP